MPRIGNLLDTFKQKKDNYDDGDDINEHSLMTDAENKYKTLVLENKWNELSPEQTQIVALTAKINKIHQLADKKLKFSNGPRNKTENDKNIKPRDKSKKQSAKKKRDKTKMSKKWAWKKEPPKDNESEEKVVEGKNIIGAATTNCGP